MRSQTNSYEVNGQPVKTAEDTEDDQTLTSCGFGSWRPKCLQPFASPIFFLVRIVCQFLSLFNNKFVQDKHVLSWSGPRYDWVLVSLVNFYFRKKVF